MFAKDDTTILPNNDVVRQDWQQFDIRNFIDRLEPNPKEKNKYLCPVCGNHNLGVEPKTGKYQCWNGCKNEDVRESIRPWSEVVGDKGDRTYNPLPPRKPKSKPKPAPLPDTHELARLPEGVSAVLVDNASDCSNSLVYQYGDWCKVIRSEVANGKQFTPLTLDDKHIWQKTKAGKIFPPYRLEEVKAHGTGKWVLLVEGEKCTEYARKYFNLVTFTFSGSDWGDKALRENFAKVKDCGVAGVLMWPDNDKTGRNKAKDCQAACDELGIPFVVIEPLKVWAECPEKGDIADFTDVVAMTGDELASLLQSQIKEAAQVETLDEFDGDRADADIDEETEADIDEEIDFDEEASEQLTFVQKAFQHLYSDSPWICVNDKLYKWEDTYYKLHTEGEEKKRIQRWCNSYAVIKADSGGRLLKSYPYAKQGNVTSALEWAKQALYVHPDTVNQAGINCLNGVLQITWDGDKPAWELADHDPTTHYFTYPPLVEYNPKADSYHCDRLLDALDPAQRDIFLKVIAASIDLPNVRRFKGRLIRALLLKGTGANGKDALKEAIATIFGKQGMTSCTLNDFQQYDDGRRFPLSNLAFSRINWASENTNSSRLDRVQSLKAAITGNTLTAEAKGKDGQDFTPNAVFLFNINDVPSLQGALEAILSRYAVISFNKTYKVNADPTKGELEADPRFAYDPLFLKTMVCPALLNKMLDALERLMREGIDYDCTKQALQDIQAENSHLWQFIQETGMGYAPNCYLSTDDIWQRLKPWYIDTGTLTFSDSGKEVWADQVRPSDKNVKALNQVLARFKQLFPQAKQASIMHPSGKKRIPVLHGVAFGAILNKDFCTAISENPTPIPPQFPPQEILTQQALHPNHPNSSNTAGKTIENDLVTEPKPADILQDIAQKPNQTSFEQGSNSKKENENLENWGGWGGTLENTGKIGVEDWGGVGVEDALIAVPNDLLTMKSNNLQQNQVTPETSAPPAITKGTRVRVHCPGSKRHGKEGVITSVKGNMAYVRLQDVETQLQDWQCPIPGNDMMRLEVIA